MDGLPSYSSIKCRATEQGQRLLLSGLTRAVKVKGLVGVLALLLVWGLVVIRRRLKVEKGQAI